MDRERSMDYLRAVPYNRHHSWCLHHQVVIQSVYPPDIRERLQQVRREFRVRSIVRGVHAGRRSLQTICNICHTVRGRHYYRNIDGDQDISSCGCSTKGVWCRDCTNLPFCRYYTVFLFFVLGSCTPCSGMGFCTFHRERRAIPLTTNINIP